MSGKGERISSLNRLIIENSGTRSRHWELGGAGRGGGGGGVIGKVEFCFQSRVLALGRRTTVERCQGRESRREG